VPGIRIGTAPENSSFSTEELTAGWIGFIGVTLSASRGNHDLDGRLAVGPRGCQLLTRPLPTFRWYPCLSRRHQIKPRTTSAPGSDVSSL